MKKVICTVGTSLFTNYFEQKRDGLEDDFNSSIKDEDYAEWNTWAAELIRLKERVLAWGKNKEDVAAEIHSLMKLQRQKKEPLDVHLLAMDTLGSALAAGIIQELLAGHPGITVFFKPELDVIEGLQVNDYQNFKHRGLVHLVDRIDQITKDFPSEQLIFNITGGYKAVIPYMSIMAQIRRAEIIYKFEDTDALIQIPKSPITIDESVFEKYETELQLLEDVIEDYHKVKAENYSTYAELEAMGLIELIDGGAALSPLGHIFWKNYKKDRFVFYCPDDVYQEILSQPDIKRIIREKMSRWELLQSKTERKQHHKVFDDGNNDNRIYYFEYGGHIYIYKTFEDEEAAKKYIKSDFDDFDKEQIINQSKPRIWRLEQNV